MSKSQGEFLSSKKLCRTLHSECPVKCLWLKSKIAQLSPMPTITFSVCGAVQAASSMKCIKELWKNYNILKICFAALTVYLLFEEFYVFIIEKPTYTSSAKLQSGFNIM